MSQLLLVILTASATGGGPSSWVEENLPLFLAVVFGLPFLITGGALYRIFIYGRSELKQKRAKATLSTATIANIEQQTGQAWVAGKTYIKVLLRLKVDDSWQGEYEAEVSWWIHFIFTPQIQPGAKVEIKVNPKDRNEIFPQAAWAGVSMADLFIKR